MTNQEFKVAFTGICLAITLTRKNKPCCLTTAAIDYCVGTGGRLEDLTDLSNMRLCDVFDLAYRLKKEDQA